MLPPRFSSIFGGGGANSKGLKSGEVVLPTLKLHTDKEVYGPGDPVVVTVEIGNASGNGDSGYGSALSLLVERLSFEIKGIEKLDAQWFATQKPVPGSKQRRGEYVFAEGSTTALVSNQIVSAGATKSYAVRTLLPNVIPPSYKGATIRYLYYVRSTISGQWLILEDPHSRGELVKDLTELEARVPLQVRVTQKNNGLLLEEGQSDGIVPSTAIQMDIFWKEQDGDSDWVRANDIYDGIEEGYESSKDEISSVSSYNPTKDGINRTFGNSFSVQSYAARSSFKDGAYLEGERTSLSSNLAPPRLSVAEVLNDSGAADILSPKSSALVSPSQQQKLTRSLSADDEAGASSSPAARAVEPLASEGFLRGRSYNIRMDDNVLLRFSPKNSDSIYYFSDMIGGTLTFFHEEGARRCLEVSITLETSETISRQFVHPSRRNSPTITKVQSDHYEVVADLVQTSFLFSIPMDGPMSFSTPHVSVQWALRFEFFTTPKNVDWTRYEHPLLIEGRDKSEWVLPITVHAPPLGPSTPHTRNEKPFSLEPVWVHN
ncbi:Reduced growth phenotype protein [Parasponia andersonii]|uniref:Reduced growth phenotype protein n=1 Tax=Parasponia andersonii TaxID=3476 RepID=A0A2P5C6S5_PARAD|nr:Reduced growth phenotype protein [Parasponia andersonii]